MGIPSEREKNLILSLLDDRIAEGTFLHEYPLASPTAASAEGKAILQRAASASDSDGVEFGLYLAHRFGATPDYLGILCELAVADWHQSHESIVRALDDLRSPASVDALYASAIARYSYRDYDDFESLGVKATWALRNLETPDAIDKLSLLVRTGNKILSAAARERLQDIANDGTTAVARAAAQRQLASFDLD